MVTTIGVLSTITLLLLTVIVISCIVKEYDVAASFGLLLILTGLLGWGMYGLFASAKTTYEDITGPVFVSKSPTTVYVEYDGHKASFETVKDYNSINDSTKFQFRITYNIYGKENSRSIIAIPCCEK